MKMTRREMLKGAAVAAAALALTACGGSSASTSTAASSTAASVAGSTAAASTDDIGFPKNETITLVVPGKAGGGSDLAIRYYSEGLNRIYGLKTTVTNAKPDGTTLTLATSALNIQYITGNATVNPMTDFTLIACLQDNGFSTLAVPANAPYDDFQGFVDYAKSHPNELNAGMPAAGANTFLFGKLCSVLGIELNKVECASESDRLTNLAGGFIDIGVVGLGNAQEYSKAGKLKVIGTVAGDGITIDQYPAELPENYKTLQEQGFKDCYMLVYHYLMGPAGMDETVVKQMNAAMEEVVNDPTVHDGIAGIGHIPGWHDLEESEELHQKEYDELVNIAKNLDMYVQG